LGKKAQISADRPTWFAQILE